MSIKDTQKQVLGGTEKEQLFPAVERGGENSEKFLHFSNSSSWDKDFIDRVGGG